MRQLSAVPDIKEADSDYPAGRIQDESLPSIVGTPLTELLYGDIIQFFHKLMRITGTTYNDSPENETAGYQLFTALIAYIRTVSASANDKGCVKLATRAETEALSDTQKVVTPDGLSGLMSLIGQQLDSCLNIRDKKIISQVVSNNEIDLNGDSTFIDITATGFGNGIINYDIIKNGPVRHILFKVYSYTNNSVTFNLRIRSEGSQLIKSVGPFAQNHGGSYFFIQVAENTWVEISTFTIIDL